MDFRRVKPKMLAIGAFAALLVGLGLTLQVRSWVALGTESGGSCGGSHACPKGTGWMLGVSFPMLIVAVPFMIGALSNSRAGRGGAGIGAAFVAIGVLPGLLIFSWAHGATLKLAWATPPERPNTAEAEGGWLHERTIIRARFDGLVAHDVASGRKRWTFDVPGTDVLCSMSRTTAGGIGLIGHAVEHKPCSNVVAIDLNTGRELWRKSLAPELFSSSVESDVIAVAGSTAVVHTDEALTAYDLRTGARRWETRAQELCRFDGVAAAGDQALTEVGCGQAPPKIRALELAGGTTRWETPVPIRGTNANVKLLSAAPAVVHVTEGGQRGVDAVVSFGAEGRVAGTIPVDDGGDLRLDINEYGFDAAPHRKLVIHGGLLVAVTNQFRGEGEIVAYELTGARVRWRVETEEVSAIQVSGDRLLVLQGGGLGAGRLRSLAPADGKRTDLGVVNLDLFTAEVALYPSGSHVAVITERATGVDDHPVAVVRLAD